MIYLVIIGLIFLLFLIWLFFSSIVLNIDTTRKEYYVAFGNQIKMSLFFHDGLPMLRANVFFFKKDIDPLEGKTKKKKTKKKEKKKKKPRKRKIADFPGLVRAGKKQVIKIIKTFRIKRFYLNIDTDDFIYNSYLAGIFSCINRGDLLLQTNYMGDFHLRLTIQNRIINILVPLISSFFILKKHFVKIN